MRGLCAAAFCAVLLLSAAGCQQERRDQVREIPRMLALYNIKEAEWQLLVYEALKGKQDDKARELVRARIDGWRLTFDDLLAEHEYLFHDDPDMLRRVKTARDRCEASLED